MKKYEFTGESKIEVYDGKHYVLKQIRAIRDITKHGVKSGALGGWLSEEAVLAHEDDAWVSGHSNIYGNSTIAGDVFIDQSYVYDSFIHGDGKLKGSYIYSSTLKKTEFQKLDNSILSMIDADESMLNLTDSSIRNLKVVKSRLAFYGSNIFSFGSVPLVVMLEGESFIAKKSDVFIKTDHPDHARIHGLTIIKHVSVTKERPLTMLTALESFVWEHLSLADMQFHYGDIRPADENGDSLLSGTEDVKLNVEGAYMQSQNSMIKGEVNLKGNICLKDTTITDNASVINKGEKELYLQNVEVFDMALVEKIEGGMATLENRSFGADDMFVF